MDQAKEEVATKRGRKRRKRSYRRIKDPVLKARKAIQCAINTEARTEAGQSRARVPNGWTRVQVDVQEVYDGIRADLIMDRMKAEGMIDQTQPGDFETVTVEVNGLPVEVRVPKTEAGMAQAALREAIIGAISPLTPRKDQVAYIRTVLEWTKKKPATDSNVNLKSEEWLEAALKDNDGYEGSGEDSAP
ncbi:hypothetical protein JQ617_08000 [Bradyrhizobium sp. KB893862 SZCCT0404]|uniref:hypothetical protein n=1 Tax=Bradyrhizobium sp. KB893862 SZCCT0404 TaxID=2807672 RepID=UPI001BA8D72A|nr:hypothetical protein [Bradyrhizobium sp. KB893862 SZCCT0404]MBR1173892.1 hypothetical protein [Bradyrhizobium sp. KB893862 SZCCT0404]